MRILLTPSLQELPFAGSFIGVNITITLGKAGRLVIPEADALRVESKEGFPIIQGKTPFNRGDIVRAIKAEREARDKRILPH